MTEPAAPEADAAGPNRPGALAAVGPSIAGGDWAATRLGPPERWPAALRTVAATCLPSRFPVLLWWGPDLLQVYNDAYLPSLGDKHPRSLGQPAAECWAEAWDDLGPLAQSVLAGGPATYSRNQLLFLRRHGFREETYWTFSYSPIPGELEPGEPGVLGILVSVHETTAEVLAGRRLHALRDLGALPTADSADMACRAAVEVLAGYADDLPFALAYLVEESGAVAQVASAGTVRSPSLDLVRRAVATGDAEFGEEVAVLPLLPSGHAAPTGALVLGLSPALALDEHYRGFLGLVAGQVSTTLAGALAYEAERRRAEALAELDRAKSEFFANVSHEFRTPLTLIAGPAEDSLDDHAEPLPDGQRQRLEVIRRNAGRLRRLVDDLLDFARIEAGRLRPETVPADLAALTREIAESFAPAVNRAGIKLVVECLPLPQPVAVDPEMWEKLVLNLLSNALKYTHEGRIEVRLTEAGGRARLAVADTGVGVPASEIPLLFKRFHRVRGTAGRSHEGAGIGLALVDELAKLHGGSVEASSVEGEGSVFTVYLPFAVDEPRASEATLRGGVSAVYLEEALQWSDDVREDAQHAVTGLGGAEHATVLIVEDNADMRRFLLRLLEPVWQVEVVSDGIEALEAARERRPDLVLTDIMMPGLDGLGLLRELRADPATASIPVIFLSARAGLEAAVEGFSSGADDYLPKPFSGHELIARVRANLELSTLRRSESEFRRAVVESLREGFFVVDDEQSVVEINTAFTAITGYGPEGLPYRWPHPWLVENEPGGVADAVLAFLKEGSEEFSVRLRRADGELVWVAASATLLEASGPRGRMLVGTLRDITAEKAAGNREYAVARFASSVAAATDVGEVLGAGLSELRKLLHTPHAVAAVWPTTANPDGFVAGAEARTLGELDPEVHQALDAMRVLRSGTVRVEKSDDGAVLGMGASLGSGDAAVWLLPDEHWTPHGEERSIFELLADRFAQALARARSYDQARAVALTLQHAILGPTDLPAGFAVRYQPAIRPLEVGGDWYDVVRLPTGRIGIVVGDCVGRGLAAAAVMGQLRSSCQALLLRAAGPAQVLEDLDTFAHRIPGALCTTVFCAVVDPETGVIRYSSAGHPSPILHHADGPGELLSQAQSLPLAVRAGTVRSDAEARLKPGSTLLLYTDGLIERRGVPLDDGIELARRAVAGGAALQPDALADRLLGALLPQGGHDDDVALLLYRHPPGEVRLSVPAVPEQLAVVRARMREWFALAAVPEVVAEDLVLAVDEACANSVEHGYAGVAGVVEVAGEAGHGWVRISVVDRGGWRKPDKDPGYRGKGVSMIRVLADEVEMVAGEDGTSVVMKKYWG